MRVECNQDILNVIHTLWTNDLLKNTDSLRNQIPLYCVLLRDSWDFCVALYGSIFIGRTKTDKVTGNIVSKLHKK